MNNSMNNTSFTVKGRIIGGNFYEKDDRGRYRLILVIDEGKPVADTIFENMKKEAVNKWGIGGLPQDLIYWGPQYGDNSSFVDSYKHWFLTAKTSILPRLVRRVQRGALAKFHAVQEEENIFYMGAYVYANLQPYAYTDNPKRGFKAGVTLTFNSMLFWKAGEALSWFNPDEAFDGCYEEVNQANQEKEEEQPQDTLPSNQQQTPESFQPPNPRQFNQASNNQYISEDDIPF